MADNFYASYGNGGSSGSGTVTEVDTGTGLTGGPITTTGTIALADTAVTPGSYISANITVDQQGRITAASSGGNGDVVGPASATDNAIARFDTTTGKLIQNSLALIDDSGNISATNLSGTNTGNVTIGTANGLSLVGQALSLALSSTSTIGALSNTDWNTFNGKQAAGNYITALTGDATASGPGSAALTLATVNTNVGSFGGATAVSTFTVNGKGLLTAAGSTSIQIAESQVTNLVSDLAGKQAAGNYITALTGDVAASGPGSVAATIQAGAVDNSKVSASAAIAFSKLAALSSANILVGNVSNVATSVAVTGDISLTNGGVTAYSGTVPINKGGTGQTTANPAFNALSPLTTKGDLLGFSTVNARLGVGSDSQVLTADAASTLGFKWAASVPGNPGYTAKTTTYAIQTTDGIIDCSGSAFTVTLPTAVGVSGKQYTITKTDSSLTNIITIATTSAQTIGAGGGTTTTLNTQGESLTIYSNGANWGIAERRIPRVQLYNTTNTVTGASSNPTKGTTSADNITAWREGDSIVGTAVLKYSTAGANGSGVYYWQVVPSGATIATTAYTAYTGSTGDAVTNCVGSATAGISGSAGGIGTVFVFDTTRVGLNYNTTAAAQINPQSSGYWAFGNANSSFSFNFQIQISGWAG